MLRSLSVITLVALCAACSMKPAVTRNVTTLGEVNMEGLDCRRLKQPGSNIWQTICASPAAWAQEDAREAEVAQSLRSVQDSGDNRVLYPGMRRD